MNWIVKLDSPFGNTWIVVECPFFNSGMVFEKPLPEIIISVRSSSELFDSSMTAPLEPHPAIKNSSKIIKMEHV
jgi:hypothetical protein